MRRAMLALATAVLLVGPTVLAFRAGGFFEEPRLVAAIVAWAVVLVAALSSSRPLPRSRAGWTALAGLVLMCAWTALSLTWAPLSDAATDNLVRLLLYAGALLAAIALLRESGARRAVEPVLALGTLVVLGYGLAGRLLPTLIEVEESARAADRLDQPITYWNAEGALAAMGLVLCARLTGDRSRPTAIRALAAAACAPLGMGLYLTYSRGAIVAAIVGLVVLVATAPSRSQLRGLGIALAAALVAASCSAALPGVASLEGTRADRETEGAVALALMLAVMLGAALLCARTVAAERQGRIPIATLRFARRLPAIAVAVAGLGLAGVVAGGLGERGGDQPTVGETSSRLTSVSSRRYDYWRIGLDAFAEDPLKGTGSGGFRVVWLRERPVREGALEVHSLALEMGAELGLPGLLALGLLLTGVGAAARRAMRREPELVAGSCAAGAVWLLHATIDWDWQLPAVTLPALVLAGALIAVSEETGGAEQAARAGERTGLRGRSAREPAAAR